MIIDFYPSFLLIIQKSNSISINFSLIFILKNHRFLVLLQSVKHDNYGKI